MKLYFEKLKLEFERHRDIDRAMAMEKYMKEKFPFYGITSPQRTLITKAIFSNYSWTDADSVKEFLTMCWQEEEREFKYTVLHFCYKYIKKMNVEWIPFFEQQIGIASWWDTVDGLGGHIISKLLVNQHELLKQYCDQWIASDNFWYQRTAIISQLQHKETTNFELLCELIKKTAHSREFFIRKAAGWALRQYSSYNPEAVINFVSHHKLSGLTIREALRKIN